MQRHWAFAPRPNCYSDPELRLAAQQEGDDLLRRHRRLAAGDGALAGEDELLALHEHVVLAVDADVGAVRAAVGEHEFFLPLLDRAVQARGLVVVDVDAAMLLAADGDGVAVAPA